MAAGRDMSTARWAVATAAAGVAAGLALAEGVSPLRLLVAIVAGIAALAVVMRWEIGPVLMFAALPLDVYGRVITKPVVLTVYQLVFLLTLASFGWAVFVARRERLRFSAVDVAWAALLFAAVWSMPMSLHRSATIVAIVRLAFLWGFTLLLSNALDRERVAKAVAITIGVSGVASSLFAIAQVKVPGFHYGNVIPVRQGLGQIVNRASAFFDDPNYLAGFLVASVIVALASLVFARTWRSAAGWAATAGICSYALVATMSRTGFVGIAAGVVVLLLVAPKDRRRWMLIVLGVLVVAVIVAKPAALVERIASIGQVQGDNSNATRVYMYVSTLEIIRDNWAFGTGLSAFDHAYPAYRKLGTLATVIRPHEIPLAVWAEMGIAGLLAELLLVGVLVAQFWRRRPHGWTVYEAIAACGLVSLLVQSLFQYYLYFEYLWLFVAFAVAANRLARRQEEDAPHV